MIKATFHDLYNRIVWDSLSKTGQLKVADAKEEESSEE